MSDDKPVIYKTLPGHVTVGPECGFRAETKIQRVPICYALTGAGLGDFICYSTALVWLAESRPWIHGRVVAPAFVLPLIRYFLREHPNWSVESGDGQVELDTSVYLIGPGLEINGQQFFNQYLNATGAHLVTLGFAYFANMTPPPPGVTYPVIRQDRNLLPAEVRALKGKYAVFTPGAVTSSRTVTGRHLNPIIDYAVSLGLTPIFLGKNTPGNSADPQFPDDINYERGVDLRNKTNLLQAACIMEHSAFVLGLDNGLLHLAACTSANIIFGYSIAGPDHREPMRWSGRTENIFLTSDDLSCANCQSNMKMLINHTFHKCFYGDLRCIDILFAQNGYRWRAAIDKILSC